MGTPGIEVNLMFVVGHTYENRRGRYCVMALRGNMLDVKYEDGTTASLDAESQERILGNLRLEGAEQTHVGGTLPKRRPFSRSDLDWTQYDRWNQAIFERFFGEYYAGRLAYVDIDDEEVSKIAPDEAGDGSAIHSFIGSIVRTLDFRRDRTLDQHFARLSQWKQGGAHTPPPFIGVLALFCLAAQRMHSDQQFGTNNYYDRLAAIVLGAGYSQQQKKALMAGFQRAYKLWEELEVWLRANGGQYGLPSARPMYGLSHVGYPISQALLRSHDRQKLPEFFWGASLDPEQEVSPADMERLMAPWVPNSSLSQAAKTSWKNEAARRRMAEVASLELSAWDGRLPTHEPGLAVTPSAPIAIEARVRSGPKPRLVWDVVFRVPPGLPAATYEVDENSKGLPMNGSYAQSVQVVSGPGERWSEPVAGISIADFLMTPVAMVEKGGRHKAVWQPRKVVVLTWDDELKAYRSQQRFEFGRRGMVLVYKALATKVTEVLATADAGEMRRIPDSWGIPQDWAVIEDIRLARIPDTGGDYDLDALIPEIWSAVDWCGGIGLPGRKQWLNSRLPRVAVNSIDEVERLLVSVHCKSALDQERYNSDHLKFEVTGNALDVDLASLALADGIYGLTVTAYRKTCDKTGDDLARLTFEVRSPGSPLGNGPESICYRSDNPLWTISAASSAPMGLDEHVAVIAGALVQPEHELHDNRAALPCDLGSTAEACHEDLMGSEQCMQRTIAGMADCFNGAHWWILSTVNNIGAFYRPADGVCKHCGLTKTFRPIGWRKLLSRESTRPKRAQSSDLGISNIIKPFARVPDAQPRDYEGLLDACFTLGGGPWSHFELMARQASDDPTFPSEAIQLFSALGHIDVELDTTGARCVRWKVASPVLVTTASAHLFLAGYRSPRLLKTIEDAVQKRGGTFTPVQRAFGPTTYQIAGLAQESVNGLVETVDEDGGVKLSMAKRPDRSIAGALTPLRGILASARIVPAPVMGEFFDVAKFSWTAKTFADSDGLYRTDSVPSLYLLRFNGTWYQVSYRTGKHLAGAFSGKSLLAYDHASLQLQCPLGAQLPGLYERAVVLSSGLPPLIDQVHAKVIYNQVPKDVASAVWAAVYASGQTRNQLGGDSW